MTTTTTTEKSFSINIHHWAVSSSANFSSLVRYCVDTEEDFITTVKKLIVSLGVWLTLLLDTAACLS